LTASGLAVTVKVWDPVAMTSAGVNVVAEGPLKTLRLRN
jgi:hypothetical protein